MLMASKSVKNMVPFASKLVFVLCFIAAFILIWFSLSKNDFKNNYVWFALGLYFLAKGIFCSVSLRLFAELTSKNSK